MSYLFYHPKQPAAGRPALVVMLHGCTQSPEDFALGTHMNMLADRHGFLVVYPAQSLSANPLGCWNWFNPEDQIRDHGEPALIAELTRRVAADHDVDPRRIFVAGFSAGGAMAVILSVVYPVVFAAAGVHSGLPYAAAHDAASALAAMSGRARKPRRPVGSQAIPTIAFHGDLDTTVDARNGALIADQAGERAKLAGDAIRKVTLERQYTGRSCTTVIHQEGTGERPVAEYWLVHGAGHAWSGGSPPGSFTDPTGPDASAEMIRFFFAQIPG